MPCGKSCFNVTLFRKNLTRFWPIWSLYLALWLFLMPLNFLTQKYHLSAPLGMVQGGLFLAIFFALLCAMAVFSYLYNPKSVQLMHALPIRREGLFLTNYLSGLAFLLLPNLLIFLLCLPFTPGVGAYTLVLWLAAQCLICLFFYSFAVFCAMFTGSLLALPVFYGILNFLALGLFSIITSLLRQFLYGFVGADGLDNLIGWLTPMIHMGERIGYHKAGNGIWILDGLGPILVYGFVGLLLAAAALLLYRRRALETAGDLVSIRPVRPLFKYGVAFCAAVSVGFLLYLNFRSLLPRGDWGILIPLLLCGLVGYFSAEMLLRKSFRVFRKSWVGGLCFSLALVALFLSTNYDLFGFSRTPQRATVESVTVYGLNTAPHDAGSFFHLTLTEEADLDAILALHGYLVDHRAAIKGELADDSGSYDNNWRKESLSDGTVIETRYFDTATLHLNYTLTDGRILRRAYDIPLHVDRLDDPGTPEGILTDLINRPEHVEASYLDGLHKNARLVDVTLPVHLAEGGYETHSIEGEANRDALWAAVRADMAAGRIGKRYLLDTVERYENCYYNDLTFHFYESTATHSEVESEYGAPYPAAATYGDRSVSITIQSTATETLKVLAELGYTTENGTLLTWADQLRLDSGQNLPLPTTSR